MRTGERVVLDLDLSSWGIFWCQIYLPIGNFFLWVVGVTKSAAGQGAFSAQETRQSHKLTGLEGSLNLSHLCCMETEAQDRSLG